MRRHTSLLLSTCLAIVVGVSTASGAHPLGLEPQPITLQSSGPLSFGPHSVLFVGDPKAATIYAIDVSEQFKAKVPASDWATVQIADLREAIVKAAGQGAAVDKVQLIDLAVDSETGNAMLAVDLGGQATLMSVTPKGEARMVALDKVLAAKVALPDPPADKVTGEGRRAGNRRMESITDLAFIEGKVLVSGLTGQEGASSVLAFEFPFRDTSVGTDLEIYHAAHGRVEETAAVRSFVPMMIDGKPSLLAGFTCTPLVQFSLGDLQQGAKVRGKTVAELGNRNRPLDMIPYESDGKSFVLVANSARGVMKVDVSNIAAQEPLTEHVTNGGTDGLPFQTIEPLQGATQLAKIDDKHCLVVKELPSKQLTMLTVELP